MSNQEIVFDRCNGCRYRRPLSLSLPQETVCHYLLDTGHSRDCPAGACTHWRPLTEPWGQLLHTMTAAGGVDRV